MLQGFGHDHLLPVHRILETDQGPGLLMDLAAGGSLLGLVASRGPLPVPEVVTALAPMAQVLGHLHREGASHGDVTPANILFTPEGKPLLADFGTGRLLGSDPVAVVGTPGFVDPSGDGSFDARADVFALAAVAWFALTGRVPAPTEQRPPLALIIPDVPPILMQLIEDGLSSTTDRRPSADDFARTLLASSAPVAVNLVPAVHPSVLPELLTQLEVRPPVPPLKGWRRIVRGHRRRQRPGTGARSSDPSLHRRGRAHRDSVPAGPVRSRPRTDRDTRSRLALAAGLAAGALLLAGIGLTLGGSATTEQPLTRPAPQGNEVTGQAPAAQDATETAPIGSASERAEDGPGTVDAHRAPPPGAGPLDPVAALGELAALRGRAFATADAGLLTGVAVEGSPAFSADHESVTALADSGRELQHLSITISDSSVLSEVELTAMPQVAALPPVMRPPEATEVSVIRATAKLSSYTETTSSPPNGRSPDGEGPSPLMAAGEQDLVFVLWNSGSGWRIHSVVSPGP